MTTTIDRQNALQIRERPMDIHVTLQTGESSRVGSYSASGQIKVDDDTLGEPAIAMRNVTDLAGDGFPLDGSCVLYDPSEQATATNGKMGLRSNIGQAVTVRVNSTNTLTSLTIATRGEGTIEHNGTSYPTTGLNVISIGANSAVLTFTPSEADERIEIDYIVPGIILEITNDNLISCTLALRSNLDVADHTWEESEIEVQVYYPYSIADSFAYVQNDWPITYQAGYDTDMSEVRYFYLSEPIEQENNVITIRGVDASHWLEEKTMQERWLLAATKGSLHEIYEDFVKAIEGAGVTLRKKQAWAGETWTGTSSLRYVIVPEQTARDYVAGVMNLTLNHIDGDVWKCMQFVDAGIPAVENGDGTVFGRVWTLNKSELGDWTESFEQNIAKINDASDERKFNELITNPNGGQRLVFGNFPDVLANVMGTNDKSTYTATKKGQVVDVSYDGYALPTWTMGARAVGLDAIVSTPSRFFGTVKADSTLADKGGGIAPIISGRYYAKNGAYIIADPAAISGGVKSFANPNNLPGITIDLEPFTYGAPLDMKGQTVFNYPSLFNRSNKTISFTWKGDPRMQPLDYIKIVDDTKPMSPATWYRITNIELTHEGGGTQASIEAREWTRPLSVPDYYVLVDDGGNYIVTNNDEEILATAEGD